MAKATPQPKVPAPPNAPATAAAPGETKRYVVIHPTLLKGIVHKARAIVSLTAEEAERALKARYIGLVDEKAEKANAAKAAATAKPATEEQK